MKAIVRKWLSKPLGNCPGPHRGKEEGGGSILLGATRGRQPLPHFKVLTWRDVGTGSFLGKRGERAKLLWMGLPMSLPRHTALCRCHFFLALFPPQSIPKSGICSGSHPCTVWLIQSLQRGLHLDSVLRKV